MDFAKSTYLGGAIILSSEADHQTCKELGLKCPICGEAVFFRSGGTREQKLKNGKVKIQQIKPSFVHYQDKSAIPSDCENRIITKEGKKRLEQIEIEGKNQRLKLYNDRLWEIFRQANEVDRERIIESKKYIGGKMLKKLAQNTRLLWFDRQSKLIEMIFAELDTIKSLPGEDIISYATKKKKPLEKLEDFKEQTEYFKYSCDLRLHKLIVKEIVIFLASKSSAHFWKNYVAYLVVVISYYEKRKKNIEINPGTLINYAMSGVGTTQWIQAIQSRLKK